MRMFSSKMVQFDFHLIGYTDFKIAGVFCFDMAAAAGITLDQLYQWNPALNGDCSGLWVGYAYCIGVSSSQAARRAHGGFYFDARPTRHVSYTV